jgi:transcriptional regulator with XRE-family HTH domain
MKGKFDKLRQEQIFHSVESGAFFHAAELPGKFAALRKAMGLTQRQMAKRLGMTQPAYLNIEKKLDASGLKTVEKFLNALNCGLELRIKPTAPFSEMIRERALKKAKSILDRTYGNMAMEKQSPGKKSYDKALKELARDMEQNPDSSVWED